MSFQRMVVFPAGSIDERAAGSRENPKKICASFAEVAVARAPHHVGRVCRPAHPRVEQIDIVHVVAVREPRNNAPAERRKERRNGDDLHEASLARLARDRRQLARPVVEDRAGGGRRTAGLRQRRSEQSRRSAESLPVGRSSYSVIGRHQREHDRSVSSPCRRRGAAEENAGDEREQQVDINDRQPIQSEPVPVERAQKARAVGSRQIHEDVQQHADRRHDREHAERRDIGMFNGRVAL